MTQLSYTAHMRKITMRDFRWMGKPQSWEKDYRSVSLTVEPQMHLPDGPLLLAVTDDDFSCDMTLSSDRDSIFCGVCFYHLPTDFIAVGMNAEALEMHVMIGGYRNYCKIPHMTDNTPVIWRMKRKGSQVSIGYSRHNESPLNWIGTFTLPGIERSVSFGPYFANEGSEEARASMSALDYRKET